MANDVSEYKNLYIKTAKEYISKIDLLLTKKRSEINDEDVNNLYIDVHSLAGQSNAMGYGTIAKLCKIVEERLKSIKETNQIEELRIIEPTYWQIKAMINNMKEN